MFMTGDIGIPGSFCEGAQGLNRLAQAVRNNFVKMSRGTGTLFRFKLTEALTAGGHAAASIESWNGSAYANQRNGTVYDEEPGGAWSGVVGDEGWCTGRDNTDGQFSIILMGPKHDASTINQSYIDLFNELSGSVGSGVKIVGGSLWLPAAFGGQSAFYGDVAGNSLAKSYKNFIDATNTDADHPLTFTNKKLFPVNMPVWDVSGSVIAPTGETISVANPGWLPIAYPFGAAVKKGDIWILQSRATNAAPAMGFYSEGIGATLTIANNSRKLVRMGNVDQTDGVVATSFNWAYLKSGDVFIRQPGMYEVTWGVSAYINAIGPIPGTANLSTSGGQTIKAPLSTQFKVSLITNYPGKATPISAADADASHLFFNAAIPPFCQLHQVEVEKTGILKCVLDNTHGQPHTRLTLAVVTNDLSTTYNMSVDRAWIVVKPIDSHGLSGGCGMDPYLGPSGAFQWWGGGPEPKYFDSDGVWV